jgi:CubicO group peptidase (beta-lactamase class C family)
MPAGFRKVALMNRRGFTAHCLARALPSLSLAAACAQTPEAKPQRWLRLRKLLDDYIESKRLAGSAIAVTAGGTPMAYLRAGRIALDAEAEFTEHSLCRIYSMTKPITGLATILLLEAGKLRLDQPVADIVPELRAPQVAIDPSQGLQSRAATRTMTIRHLLTHSAGLAYWTPERGTDALSTAYRARGITPGNYGAGLLRPGYGPQASDLTDMVKRLAELPLAAEPGTVWRYSVGLDVLGLIVERLSGKPLDEFCRQRIFEPLGMASTGFHVREADQPRLTTNYTVTARGLAPLDPRQASVFLQPAKLVAGGAGLVSTARDFARIGAMLIGEGKLKGVRVLRADSVRLACSNLLPAAVRYEGGGYGAGMRVGTGGKAVRDGAGAVSWNGAAGTMWAVDAARQINFVFMSQFMPPTAYPVWSEVDQALAAECSAG